MVLFEEVDGPGVLLPGISLRIFNGHTRAQQLPLISDGAGNSVFFCADLFSNQSPYQFTVDHGLR